MDVDVDVNVDYNDGRVSQLLHYSYVVRYSTQLDSTLDSIRLGALPLPI